MPGVGSSNDQKETLLPAGSSVPDGGSLHGWLDDACCGDSSGQSYFCGVMSSEILGPPWRTVREKATWPPARGKSKGLEGRGRPDATRPWEEQGGGEAGTAEKAEPGSGGTVLSPTLTARLIRQFPILTGTTEQVPTQCASGLEAGCTEPPFLLTAALFLGDGIPLLSTSQTWKIRPCREREWGTENGPSAVEAGW